MMSICLVKQNGGMWVENINVFYSTFTNVFLNFCHVFYVFLTFLFFLERFLHLWFYVHSKTDPFLILC